MPRMPKTLLRLREQHPDKIDSISAEQSRWQQDGYWVYLKAGWQCGNIPPSTDPDGPCGNLHQVHEWTMKDLLREFRHNVFPCTCWDCEREKAKASK